MFIMIEIGQCDRGFPDTDHPLIWSGRTLCGLFASSLGMRGYKVSSRDIEGALLRAFFLTAIIILLGTGACSREITPTAVAPTATPTSVVPVGTVLPFQTVEQGIYGDYSVRQPRAVLITSPQDIPSLNGTVSPESRGLVTAQLQRVDFQRYVAIVVFRGRKATHGFDVTVEAVAREGDKLVVYAQFWEPSPSWAVANEATSPFHIITVPRDAGLPEDVEIVLRSRPVTPTPPPAQRP